MGPCPGVEEGAVGTTQGCEHRSQGVILFVETISTFVHLVALPLPRHSGRVVQQVSEVIFEGLMSLEEVHCHAPNMFGTVNMKHTIDSRLSWSEQ